MTPRNVVLLGIAAVVVYDTLASIGSLALGFPYAGAAVGSLAIYFGAGFFAARYKSRWFGLLAGLVVGLSDATIGWGISWALGPGRFPAGTFTFVQLLLSAASAVVLATICAGIGSVIGGFFTRRAP